MRHWIRKTLVLAIMGLSAFGAVAYADDISNGSWNTTDASNNAAPPNGWPAGMFPNQVEPSARADKGGVKRWWERQTAVITTTGSAGAYVYTPSNTSYPTALTSGEIYCAKANFTSVGNDTLNVDALGAENLYVATSAGVAQVAAGQIVSGQMFCSFFNSALNSGAGGFQILGGVASIPSGAAGGDLGGSYPNPTVISLSHVTTGTLGVANGGTGITSGTSGGIPYFSASGTIASSAALTANQIVLGGGAGTTPATLGSLGTTTTVLHGNAAGAPTFGAVSLTADVSGTLPVGNGGIGAATLASNGILYGNGASAIQALAVNATATKKYLQQASSAAPSWAQIAAADLSDGVSGSGAICLVTSCTMVTPTIGVATATTINKVTITAPATSATLTIADGKTLTASNNATVSGTNTGDQTITLTGDVTGSGTGSFAATIASGAVTATKTATVVMGGFFRNLSISYPGGLKTGTITADAVEVVTANDATPFIIKSLSATLSIATNGAVNKLDTGTAASSTLYYLWAISNGTTNGVLASLSSTAPTMPSGYTYKARIGAFFTDGSANIIAGTQLGREFRYSTPLLIASGTAGTYSATAPTYFAVTLTGTIPPTASRYTIQATNRYNSAGSSVHVLVAPNNNYGGVRGLIPPPPLYLDNAGSIDQAGQADFVYESSNVYFVSDGTGGALFGTGWEDNL